MKVVKNLIWGIFAILFVVGVVFLFKVGISYSKNENNLNDNSSLKHEITMKVDKIVKDIKLIELKDDSGVFMCGDFVNTTGYDLPKVSILYEIVGSDGVVLREGVVSLGRVKKGAIAPIKISVGGMFDYSIRITSSTNIGM